VIGYIIHRFVLHGAWLQPSFLTRKHKHWYHALPKLGPFTATYDHPAAYIFNHFLPTFLAAAILRLHLITYLIYLALISTEGTLAYCDFNCITSGNLFTIAGAAGRQARKHLQNGGNGNFGGLEVLDWICGTKIAPASDAGNDDDDDDDVVEIRLRDLSNDIKQRVRERANTKRRRGPRILKRKMKDCA
ncbi:hypothetical protein KEM54_004493, partial [Ascosphaera aggregata]